MKILELLRDFRDGKINSDKLYCGLNEALKDNEHDGIIYGCLHIFYLMQDNYYENEDALDGFVAGALSIFDPCPVYEEYEGVRTTVRGGSNNKTVKVALTQ